MDCITSSSGISEIIRSSDPVMTTVDKIVVSGFGGEAGVDSAANDSLDEDEVVDIIPSIEQISTQASSDPRAGGEGAATFRVEAETGDRALVAFGWLAVCANDGSVLAGLFIPVFILSTPDFVAHWAPFCPAVVAFIMTTPPPVLGTTRVATFVAAALGTSAKCRVVKITRSNSEVLLRTTKHTMIYPDSGPSSEVIAPCPAIWYWRWTGVSRGEQRARDVHVVRGIWILYPLPEG
jgi:hypothetical protein